MEQKKHPQQSGQGAPLPPRMRGRDTAKRPAETVSKPANAASGNTGKGTAAKSRASALGAFGIELNPSTARQAIVLSEIIGKPVSKRRGFR